MPDVAKTDVDSVSEAPVSGSGVAESADALCRPRGRPRAADREPLILEAASELLDEGIYVIGFFFPVVPKGQARIRTQMSAAHTPEQIDRAVDAFVRVGRRLGVLKV